MMFVVRLLNVDERVVQEQLKILIGQNLIREMEPGKFVRKVFDEKTGKSFTWFLFSWTAADFNSTDYYFLLQLVIVASSFLCYR